eukprot:scaffold31709_cov118-Isochrysis_galbana.AAC.9
MLGLRVVLKHGSDPAAASAPRCAGDAIPLATQGIANGSRVSRELRLLLRTAGARRARPFKRPAVGAVTLAAEHPPALSHATCRARRGTHPGRLFTQELRCRNLRVCRGEKMGVFADGSHQPAFGRGHGVWRRPFGACVG